MLRETRLPDRALVSARLKRLKSIYRKLRRSPKDVPVNRMDDIIGFRVVCETLDDAVSLRGRIRDSLSANIKDYLHGDHPAGLGYRAIHAIIRFKQPFYAESVKVRFEIQVRTWYQHLWACWCESFGEQAKEGFPNVELGSDAFEKKNQLQHRSDELRKWENACAGQVQETLPDFSDPYNVAVAWFNHQQDYGFDPFGRDVAEAVRNLTYLETQTDVEPLLLVGVAPGPRLEGLLRQTHPNFFPSGSLDPEYWMPGTS